MYIISIISKVNSFFSEFFPLISSITIINPFFPLYWIIVIIIISSSTISIYYSDTIFRNLFYFMFLSLIFVITIIYFIFFIILCSQISCRSTIFNMMRIKISHIFFVFQKFFDFIWSITDISYILIRKWKILCSKSIEFGYKIYEGEITCI